MKASYREQAHAHTLTTVLRHVVVPMLSPLQQSWKSQGEHGQNVETYNIYTLDKFVQYIRKNDIGGGGGGG